MSSHHLHHDKHNHHDKHKHHRDGQPQMQQYGAPYGAPQPSVYGAGNYPSQVGYASSYSAATYQPDPRMEASSQASYANEHKHKRNEHVGEVGALAAGAFALYEHHQVKVDPAHAGRHRIEESMAAVVATGLGGYALHEHHEIHHGHKHDKHHKKHGF